MITSDIATLLTEDAKQKAKSEQAELACLVIKMGEYYIRRNARRGYTRAMVYVPIECWKTVREHFITQGFWLESQSGNKMIFSWGEKPEEEVEGR